MVYPQRRASASSAHSSSALRDKGSREQPDLEREHGFEMVANDRLRRRMEALLIPQYITLGRHHKMGKTAKTTRFHALDMELFVSQRRAGSTSEGCSNQIDLVGTGVYRTAKIPENYSLLHLAAFVCFSMGWPMETQFKLWVRPNAVEEGGIEVWFCMPAKTTSSVGAKGDTGARSSIKLSEVWNPYGLTSNRLRPFIERPYFAPGSLSIRIRCEGASLHSPSFSINEPFAISGVGAPPASYLPRLRDGRELRENLVTKRFEGWAFAYNFSDYLDGQVVSEVDVEGVHVWEIDSNELAKRLDILERRIGGNWIADLEEHAIEFDDFLVIPRFVQAH